MSWITEDGLIEYAMDEAADIASCLWKFRQNHPSCAMCRNRNFCDLLMKQLKEWEEEEDQPLEESK